MYAHPWLWDVGLGRGLVRCYLDSLPVFFGYNLAVDPYQNIPTLETRRGGGIALL